MKKFSLMMVLVLTVLIATTASAWTRKSNADLQVYFGVSTSSSPVDKLKETRTALEYHLAQVNRDISSATNTPATSTQVSAMVTVRASSTLMAVTNNDITTSLSGIYSLNIQAMYGDIYPYNADVVLKNAQTGAMVASSTVRMVPSESGNDLYIAHKIYGNMTVSKVPEGAVKRYSISATVIPKGFPAGNYVMEIKNVRYFGPDLITSNPPTMQAKNVSLDGVVNFRTNTAFYDGSLPAAPVKKNIPAPRTSLSDFFKNMTASVSGIFGR